MSKTILVVEDYDIKLNRINCVIRDCSFDGNIVHIGSLNKAVNYVTNHRPDLIILDMNLPIFSEPNSRSEVFGGIDVIRTLEYEESNCPVVIVSSFSINEVKEELGLLATRVLDVLEYSDVVDKWKSQLSKIVRSI